MGISSPSGYPKIQFYHCSSSQTYLNVHSKFHTPTSIPSGMIINEDGTGQTDRHTYTGGAHLKIKCVPNQPKWGKVFDFGLTGKEPHKEMISQEDISPEDKIKGIQINRKPTSQEEDDNLRARQPCLSLFLSLHKMAKS